MLTGFLLVLLLTPSPGSGASPTDRPALEDRFREQLAGRPGCFVLLDAATGTSRRVDAARCARRFTPASTFKIPHALIALDTGILEGPETVLPWDGVTRSRAVLDRDHDLRSAVAESVVWYFQEVARRIGAETMAARLRALGYGNADVGGGLTTFWLGSSLEISADEQVAFLDRLRRGALPASPRAQEVVADVLVVRRLGDGSVVRGKTGTHRLGGGRYLGWFVGWLETDGRDLVFAMNFEGEGATGWAGRDLTLRLLEDLGLGSAGP